MGNLAVINCVTAADYALRDLGDGKSAFDRVVAFARALPAVEEVVCLIPADGTFGGEDETLRRVACEANPAALLKALAELGAEREGGDSLFYMYGDTPLLDSGLTLRMYENHRRYRADFTFADAYPVGLAPEILRISALPPLSGLAEGYKGELARDTLFEVLRRDINAFEIETIIPPLDLRLLRIRLAAENPAGMLLLHRVMAAGADGADAILHYLNDHQEHLRTLPSYLSIQITGGCPQACSYCPYSSFGGDILNRTDVMACADFERLLDEFVDFSGGGYVNLSPWGEPALHPEIGRLLAAILDRPDLRGVIETAGIGWDRGLLEELAGKADGRITWIVSLDALKPATYRALRGEGFEEAQATAELLLRLFPDTAFVQAVRMDANEEELEEFYRGWKQKTENIIIQKYDYFCGRLPQRRVADISPLKRNPCWHLKRDLTVLIDGAVSLCREDYEGAHPLGNIFTDGFETVWRRGEEFYRRHVDGDYPQICRNCDEYYTFNF